VPSKPVPPATSAGAPGSVRARLRLAAVVLLALLTIAYLLLAVRLYFFPTGSAVGSGVVGVVFGVAALAYGLLARAVVKQSRAGHIAAAVVCAVGAVLSVSAAMAWPDWTTLGINAASFCLLLGCVPGKVPPAS
jgi:hypothetical protein